MPDQVVIDTTPPEPAPPPADRAEFPDGSTGRTFTVVADDTPILAALIAQWNAKGAAGFTVVDA